MKGRLVAGAFASALAVVLLASAACDQLFPHRSEGETLWRQHCAECHGLDGAGNTVAYMGNPWADLTDNNWKTGGGDPSSFEDVVRDGVFGLMPADKELTHEQVRTLYEYLRVLRHEKPPEKVP